MELLVMGAYGHSQIREFFVGTTTTKMVRTGPVPVLVFRWTGNLQKLEPRISWGDHFFSNHKSESAHRWMLHPPFRTPQHAIQVNEEVTDWCLTA